LLAAQPVHPVAGRDDTLASGLVGDEPVAELRVAITLFWIYERLTHGCRASM